MKSHILIDYFNGDIDRYTVAKTIANVIIKRLNPSTDFKNLVSSLSRMLDVVKDGITGQAGWGTIGKYIAQLAVDIYSILPQARYADIVAILWESAGLL